MQKKLDESSTSGEKLLRLFRKLLVSKGKHYQSELAEYLNCSPQTVIRLVEQIAHEVGDDFHTGLDNRRRWYSLSPSTRNILGVDSDELRCLSICRDLADPYLSKSDRDKVDNTLLNISMILSETSQNQDADLDKQPHYAFFSKGRIDYSHSTQHIASLNKAIQEKLICVIRYRSSGSKQVYPIRFAPGSFVCVSNALYVLGELVDDSGFPQKLYSLAIHRMLNVVVTDDNYVFNMPKMDLGDFSLPWHDPVTFKVSFAPGKASDYVRERTWAQSQKLRELSNGGVELTITTRSGPEFMAWVRSFGKEVTSVSSDKKVE
jgi:hypothetical protein